MKVKNELTSTTVKPVTQEALTDINKASIKSMPPFSYVMAGSISKSVPINISKMKLLIKVEAGLSSKSDILVLNFVSSRKIRTRRKILNI